MPTLKEEILILLKEGLLFYLSDPFRQFKIGTPYKPGSYYNAVRRLAEEGHIEKLKDEKERRIHIKLTEQGKRFIKKHQEVVRSRPCTWDKKWRLVIFDISEKKRNSRDRLRRYLKMLGFGKVQRSIWISPYNFAEIIKRYADKLKLTEDLFQVTVDEFHGLSESVLVEKFWNIMEIHNIYLKLIERYTEKQDELKKRHKQFPRTKDSSRRILREHLVWDYQSIRNSDPHLPLELLPSDWGGEQARKFVEGFFRGKMK